MASICSRCRTAHDPNISCFEAGRKGEQLMQRVRHHQEHCDDRCSENLETAYWHVLKLRREKRSPLDRTVY